MLNLRHRRTKKARLLFKLVQNIVDSEMLEYNNNLQKKVERGGKTGGCTKKTLRNSHIKSRKSRTRKFINVKQHKMHGAKSNHWKHAYGKNKT